METKPMVEQMTFQEKSERWPKFIDFYSENYSQKIHISSSLKHFKRAIGPIWKHAFLFILFCWDSQSRHSIRKLSQKSHRLYEILQWNKVKSETQFSTNKYERESCN